MSNRTFYIKAIWDDEAKVFYSESDISGLHIEAETLEEFEALIHEHALALVIDNHISKADIAGKTLLDLIPAILWQPPSGHEHRAVA